MSIRIGHSIGGHVCEGKIVYIYNPRFIAESCSYCNFANFKQSHMGISLTNYLIAHNHSINQEIT